MQLKRHSKSVSQSVSSRSPRAHPKSRGLSLRSPRGPGHTSYAHARPAPSIECGSRIGATVCISTAVESSYRLAAPAESAFRPPEAGDAGAPAGGGPPKIGWSTCSSRRNHQRNRREGVLALEDGGASRSFSGLWAREPSTRERWPGKPLSMRASCPAVSSKLCDTWPAATPASPPSATSHAPS